MQGKKTGVVFFQEGVCELRWKKTFELYFCLGNTPLTKINAFPIPVKDFKMYKNHVDQLHFLLLFYERYYCLSQQNHELLLNYDYKNPYIGRDFIWYYKR